MKKSFKLMLISIMMFIYTNASAQSLSRQDWIGESIVGGMFLVDYKQTIDIKNHNNSILESNIILGEHPGDAKIRNYFIVSSIVHLAVMRSIPSNWRPIWQLATIVVETHAINNNRQIGLRINF